MCGHHAKVESVGTNQKRTILCGAGPGRYSHARAPPQAFTDCREAEVMEVVGPKEVQSGTVTVRCRSGWELGTAMKDDFLSRIQHAVENRTSFQEH